MNLRIDHIRKAYPEFLLDLNLEVRQGELLILLGPSGCGKTTSLRLLAGFIRADEGSLHLAGRRIDTLPPHQRHIGLVFQDYALFPHLTVRDNIAFGLRMQRWDTAAIGQRVEELLALVSLKGYEKRKVTRLSGGEQQRVALARALAPKPQLLLLDEPLSALDARLRKNLRCEIKRIQRELGVTTVYVTHDQEEALVLGDRIAVMRSGCIEQIDTPERVYNHPANLFVASFLGDANLLPGRLAGRDGSHMLVETATGLLRVSVGGREDLNEGDDVTVFFRPESCDVSCQGPNRLAGRIVRREYLGSHYAFELEDRDRQRYILAVPLTAKLPKGEWVEFSVEPGNLSLFPTTV